MSDEQQSETLYVLVDISNLEGTSFLKRAPMKQILLWAKIFGMEGKPTKRLDLIFDVQTLQYLYWNSSQQPPMDDLDTMVVQCAELSTHLTVDETSAEELTSRIPAEVLKNTSQKRREEETKYMGQGSKTNGAIEKSEKSSAKKPNDDEESKAIKAAEQAAKDAAKAAKVAEKEAVKKAKADAMEAKKTERAAAKAAKAAAPKAPKEPKVDAGPRPSAEAVDAIFVPAGEAGLASAMAKVQSAFLAQPVRASGKKDSDPHKHAVSVNIKQTASGVVQATLVSMVWFASVVTGMSTSHFYRRDAIGLIQKLGLVALHDGQPVPVQPTAEAKATEKAAKEAEKLAARDAKKAEREAVKLAKKTEREAAAKAKADAIVAAATPAETDEQIAAGV